MDTYILTGAVAGRRHILEALGSQGWKTISEGMEHQLLQRRVPKQSQQLNAQQQALKAQLRSLAAYSCTADDHSGRGGACSAAEVLPSTGGEQSIEAAFVSHRPDKIFP